METIMQTNATQTLDNFHICLPIHLPTIYFFLYWYSHTEVTVCFYFTLDFFLRHEIKPIFHDKPLFAFLLKTCFFTKKCILNT